MATSMVERNFLLTDSTCFFLCDIQEKFRPVLSYFDEITEVAKRLVAASKLLEIPLVVTEQVNYTLGLQQYNYALHF